MNPPNADLYLNQINVRRYCPDNENNTNNESCPSKNTDTCIDTCPLLGPEQRQALKTVLGAREYLPSIPSITDLRPIEPKLTAVNQPDSNSLVIVTANSSLTFDVILTVWSQGITPAYFLLVDCLGNTLDMAVVLREFKPERLKQAITDSGLEGIISHRHMIVPGLTAPLAEDFKKATGWDVEVGPICAAELPLFLGNRWIF